MADSGTYYNNEGASQKQRWPRALQEDYVQLDERTQQDLEAYIRDLARHVRFFNLDNQDSGESWAPFFEALEQPESVGNDAPHIALLRSFLRKFGDAQKDLNRLMSRHLDFYYQDVLGLKPKPAVPDKVHVLFELSKNTQEHRLESGTLLLAGKDAAGNPIHFATDHEVVINKALVRSLKTLYKEIGSEGGCRIFAAPVANSLDGKGKPFSKTQRPLWRPFGEKQSGKSTESRTMETARIGFAIASPLFLLGEGTRNITLKFALDQESAESFSASLLARLSGEKEWIERACVAEIAEGYMTVVIELLPEDPAVTGYSQELTGDVFPTQWPVLQLLVPDNGYSYPYLAGLRIQNVVITVHAEGVKNLIVQNDQSVLDATKPFLPFGSQPGLGSNFYIGSAEVFCKKFQNLSFDISWKDKPANIADPNGYYIDYGLKSNLTFPVQINLLKNGSWGSFIENDVALFDGLKNAINCPDCSRTKIFPVLESYDQNTREGFLRIQLKGHNESSFFAFGHKLYPTKFAEGLVAETKFTPEPPYTPEIESLTLSYSSTETCYFDASNGIEQFFYLEPFGFRQTEPSVALDFMPHFEEEGHLYIGLEDLEPMQQISLLCQIAEGTQTPEATVLPDELAIKWSYLAGDRWQELRPALDTTGHWQHPGIIRLSLPEDATRAHTLMPAGLHWIRVQVEKFTEGISSVEDIQTQAAEATRVLSDQATISTELAAGLIQKLAISRSAISKVIQPYKSFGGRETESDRTFRTRSSERLRHRGRAITAWDYERLVLEAFPEMMKVKCLLPTTGADTAAPAAGQIILVVVPALDLSRLSGLTEPRAGALKLLEIEHLVGEYSSPFVKVKVRNPVYEHVIAHVNVGFRPGFDEGYYRRQLEEELIRHLTPWAFEADKEVVFGGTVYRSEVLEFIESRTYVDVVYDLKLYHMESPQRRLGIGDMYIDGNHPVWQQFMVGEKPPFIAKDDKDSEGMIVNQTFVIGYEEEVIRATRPDAVLVSNFFHYIEIGNNAEYACN